MLVRMNPGLRCLVTIGAAAVLATLMAAPARPLPSFSRSTGLSCGGCHRDGPQLNERGLAYLANGYRMLDAHGSQSSRFPGLSVEGGVGLGVSADEWPTRRVQEEGPTRSDRASMLEVHSAGTLESRWSWHVEQRVGTTSGSLETRTATIAWSDLLPRGLLDVRAGRFESGLPFLSTSRRPLLAPYRMPVSLDVTGAELGGRDAAWDYAVGVTSDHRTAPGGPEPTRFLTHLQDTYFWASRAIAGQRIGARLWFDRQDSDLAWHRWLQHMQHEVAASLHAGRVEVTPAYMLDRYDDRPAAELHDKHHLALLEVSTPIDHATRWWVGGRVEHEYRTRTPYTPEHDAGLLAFDLAYDPRPDTRLALEWSHASDNLGAPRRDALDAFVRIGH